MGFFSVAGKFLSAIIEEQNRKEGQFLKQYDKYSDKAAGLSDEELKKRYKNSSREEKLAYGQELIDRGYGSSDR